MDKLIDFSNVIYSLLTGSTTITDFVDDRIFPIVIPDSVLETDKVLPLIVFEYDGENNFVKNGYYNSEISVDIYVFSDDLLQIKSIAKAVNGVLNQYEGQILNTEIVNSLPIHYAETQMTGSNLNAFLAKLTYSITIA